MANLFAPDKDPKTKLNTFCQKFTGRMIAKGDVAYTCGKVQGTNSFQGTVQLMCIEGQPVFAGELKIDKKDAEQDAARQALLAFDDEIQKIIANPQAGGKKKNNNKRAASAAPPGEPGAQVPKIEQVQTPKMELNMVLMRLTKRTLTKNDSNFETGRSPYGSPQSPLFSCNLTLPCLPEPWCSKVWSGNPTSNQKDAEHSAASVALEEIKGDPEFAEMLEKNAAKKAANAGKLNRWEQMQSMMYEWLGGGERKKVSEDVLTGDIVKVQGPCGYIKPHMPVEHQMAAPDGNIWFTCKDCNGFEENKRSPEWCKQGTMVTFQLYEDPASGLGAENITGF
eukprot:TRINITY_DN27081_c0_g1_i1.p1 TRINITY_DN27081_c0_g1~~TRINITY_DN27081_c0_g1_i1.p1  ORF type:complete len:337 (+),score=99.45 TRINITY_DN27081_c0_g1_i1:96-1106(+)